MKLRLTASSISSIAISSTITFLRFRKIRRPRSRTGSRRAPGSATKVSISGPSPPGIDTSLTLFSRRALSCCDGSCSANPCAAQRQGDRRDDRHQQHHRRDLERRRRNRCRSGGPAPCIAVARGQRLRRRRQPEPAPHQHRGHLGGHQHPTAAPSGRYCQKPSRSRSRLISSIMTTNRNSTITAPT